MVNKGIEEFLQIMGLAITHIKNKDPLGKKKECPIQIRKRNNKMVAYKLNNNTNNKFRI